MTLIPLLGGILSTFVLPAPPNLLSEGAGERILYRIPPLRGISDTFVLPAPLNLFSGGVGERILYLTPPF